MPYQAQWHPCYMGSTMFAPVVYATHMLAVCFALVLLLLAVEWAYEWVVGPPPAASRYLKVSSNAEDQIGGFDTTLEMAPVMKIRE